MNPLEDTVRALADEREIINLTARYCWALDERALEQLRDIFLPAATADLGSECNGIDEIIARIGGALDPLDATQHVVSTHHVVVDGDAATCRCYLLAQHVRRQAEGGSNYMIAGFYSDQLERTNLGWRIRRRNLTRVWNDGNLAVVRP